MSVPVQRCFPRRGPPHSFGWMRRPKDDEPGFLAWEMPKPEPRTRLGVVVLLPVGVNRLIQFLPSLPPVLDQTTADDPA